MRPVTGDSIDSLSYGLVANYVCRKAISLSKSKLETKIRADWSEFLRVEIPRVAYGRITVGEFIAQLNAHEAKLTDARKASKNAGKTPEASRQSGRPRGEAQGEPGKDPQGEQGE